MKRLPLDMTSIVKLSLFQAILYSCISSAEIAVEGEPLKDSYRSEGTFPAEMIKTTETADSYSLICDIGQAIPNKSRGESWYINKPIPGLRLELRARLVSTSGSTMGFTVITKNGEVLSRFKPLGDNVLGKWEGDVFSSWDATGTDIEVASERFGRSGLAQFDLISGNGFFYKKGESQDPDYFLSNCHRIKKPGLPIYNWNFDDKR